jgi:flavin-dependent dehydrogenase
MSANPATPHPFPSGGENGAATDRYDVLILGGGITGLCLALQLTRAMPGIRVLVAEKQPHPVPEAAHKVGESSVEVQAHYLRDILGLGDHLHEEQLHKFGLRMFFTHDDNTDITSRVEYGQIGPAPLPSYQLDRGRLENRLGELIIAGGVDFRPGAAVQKVDLRSDGQDHSVLIEHDGAKHEIKGRWVVDATGRSAVLKRKLGLAKRVEHRANACWLRVAHPVDVDDWSTDVEWLARVTDGERRLSTNHLMGPGYWVWLIPLASGSTSIGIVAEADSHPFAEFNRLDRAMDWLRRYEPQCAAAIEEHWEKIQDFRVMKDYAYGCEQVYSEQRWCLTGEAGVSIDPLYSSGGDLMAVGNGLITDLVVRDLRGEDVSDLAQGHNQLYLILAQVWLVAYENQYALMGNPQVMVAKVIWDTIVYWAFPGLLFFQDKFRRLGESAGATLNLYRCWQVHERVQRFLREWHEIDNPPASDTFADPYSLLDFIVDLHTGMAAELTDDELELQFTRNARLLEQVAGQLVSIVIERLAPRGAEPEVRQQLDAWANDPLLDEVMQVYREDDESNPIDSSWITLGHHGPDKVLEVAP